MTKGRLEAFSDGVIAIIITIMVLELKVPHDSSWEALKELIPVFSSYLLSFIFIAIYWGNHHHLIHAVKHVNAKLIWANMSLLFTLSIVPFSTAWMGENEYAQNTVVLYAINLLTCGFSFWILQIVIGAQQHEGSSLTDAIEKQKKKGYISLALYIASIGMAFIQPLFSAIMFAIVSVLWIIPDKNIEKELKD